MVGSREKLVKPHNPVTITTAGTYAWRMSLPQFVKLEVEIKKAPANRLGLLLLIRHFTVTLLERIFYP
jgi:hypothetical protein